MTLNLTVQDKLRASSVDRWHIVSTARRQSLAEHSFNVAIIGEELVHRLSLSAALKVEVMRMALLHDLDEVVKGDIPSPVKGALEWPSAIENPWQVIKTADVIDQYTFISEYGLGHHGKQVAKWVYNNRYHPMVDALVDRDREIVESVTDDIMLGEFRFG